MQIDEADLVDGRPVPPKGCPGKMGTNCPRKVQRRGAYETNSSEMPTFCFRCVLCGKLFSVQPEGRLPHQSQSVEQIERSIEDTLSAPAGLADENPSDRRRRRRAFNAFESQRMLMAALFSLNLDTSVGDIWTYLKTRHGSTQNLVEALHRNGLSLTGIYRSLSPWWNEGAWWVQQRGPP